MKKRDAVQTDKTDIQRYHDGWARTWLFFLFSLAVLASVIVWRIFS